MPEPRPSPDPTEPRSTGAGPATRLPGQARVVIVGGGIVGCSVAYHLVRLGWRDVLLLERRALSSGTTWHAAGLVGQLRASHNLTRLAKYGGELYERLEAETGQATGFRRPGSLAVARTAERMVELKRGASMARCFDVEVEVVSPAEAGRRWPLMRTDDLVGALWIPGDGRTNPTDTVQALARGARLGGATIVENATVTAVHTRNGAVAGVTVRHAPSARESETREVACEAVVNCAGMWGREVGRMAGVAVPLHASEHFYIVTDPLAGIDPDLPVLRDPDGYLYVREEVGGLLLGGFEPVAKPWGMAGIPEDFAFSLLPEDWDHFQVIMEQAIVRIPALETVPVRRHVNGPESFTPDVRYMLGEAPELRRFFVAAGFNSVGIASAAGAGKALAEWIVDGRPSMDLWDVDLRRFQPWQANPRYLRDRTVEALGLLYAMHWPFRQVETARPARRSPLHDRLAARGACFGVVAGWERPNWYAPPGVRPEYRYTYGRPEWFPHWAAEHRAVREEVGLFDQTSFAKFLVEGPDAELALQRLAANDVGGPVGRVAYTAMLDERGGIQCDLTVTRLGPERYLVVTAAATAAHDLDWIRRHLPGDARVTVTDATSAYAVLGVMGPRSRELLARLTEADLSSPAFPFATSREIHLAYATVRALRVTYVGELGWELYVPTEFATGVYDALVAEGSRFGLRHAGYHAMDSLRQEKAYRSWGHDITPDDTPLEAGLGFVVAFDKAVPFIGREALLPRRGAPLARRLLTFTLDDPEPVLYGDEPIWRDGRLVGRITSGSYGHTLGRAVGMGYVHHEGGVDREFLGSGRWELELATERHAATVHHRPPYDPTGARVRA
jgi:4-methylaminobutanoate oxidase (formaldehyde-forming)